MGDQLNNSVHWSFWLVGVLCGLAPQANAQDDPLFASDEPLAITLEMPMDIIIKQADDKPGHVELLGVGNAKLEGRTFNATAHEVSFDESKGLYILRSKGSPNASIWRQTAIGGKRSYTEAERMHFTPSTNELQLFGITGIIGLE